MKKRDDLEIENVSVKTIPTCYKYLFIEANILSQRYHMGYLGYQNSSSV